MAEPYDPCECIVDGFARKRAYGTIQMLKPKAKALLSLYMRGVRMKSTGLLKVVCTAALAASCYDVLHFIISLADYKIGN